MSSLAWKSYNLQDGYRLQGFIRTHGRIYKSYIFPVITEGVMGVEGCRKGYIYGWVIDKQPKSYFIINTGNDNVSWLNGNNYFTEVRKLGCKSPDMNHEINLTEFELGHSFISR
ncbi:MAG: hypothetical protein ABJH06_05315 [Paraglaciecola sp.]|uniref:hypothetical protein n=1 Tax=Paraglaciecola sp. TaxID=1920173 RepID=UPI003297B17A